MDDGAVYRRERDGSETIIGFGATWSDAQMLVDDDMKKIDYLYGYRWMMPEEGRKHVAESNGA